ncbi:hypothetical protein MYK68_04875 [Gordonia sp. PP30]|uniref:hypothetical protein n=1 Tax=Gordonia sp. PP30 TaxID=2935861 RepID=UPI001FFF4D84|nr:hypothetical protein [Gordonia sp. PP30]UQE75936.1 hypothetical protein MYK68_04875 [Gordonia sp. PP30]
MSAAQQRGHRYNPWLHAQELGLAVTYRRLPDDMCGAYDHSARTVILDPELTVAQERVTLAHEIEHHRRGHAGPQSAQIESGVDRAVLRRLVDFDVLARFLDRGFVVDKPLHRDVLAHWLGVDGPSVCQAVDLL